MTHLQRRALIVTPLPKETVETWYAGPITDMRYKALCESHERLRAELQGAEVLLREAGIWPAAGD